MYAAKFYLTYIESFKDQCYDKSLSISLYVCDCITYLDNDLLTLMWYGTCYNSTFSECANTQENGEYWFVQFFLVLWYCVKLARRIEYNSRNLLTAYDTIQYFYHQYIFIITTNFKPCLTLCPVRLSITSQLYYF